jgi:four helix bundle protein
MIKSLLDLEIFTLSYKYSMEIFQVTRKFPKEEKYSLIDQIIRSSRSISANIAEGWGKRIYINEFKRSLVYAMGSVEETKTWLYYSRDCNYIQLDLFDILSIKLNEIGSKIFKLYENWRSI